MNSKFRATTIFALLILASCNREHKSTAIAPTEEIPRDLVIILERGICFGTCPAYKLTITANGSVEFEGRHYVKKKGIVRATISREQLKRLIAEFEKASYLKLQDRYVGEKDGCATVLTDDSTVITSITIAGKTKSVEHYHGCEGPLVLEQLTVLENRIDEVVNAPQWFDENNQ
jgi:Domain of unknown function (DUF6438)